MKHHPAFLVLAVLTLAFILSPTSRAAEGSWKKLNNSISGKWEITSGANGHTLKLTGFKTRKAPDLKLYLSPLPSGSITGKNATNGTHFIAKLRATKGDQTYTIPASVDLSKYKSLLLHCEKYSKPWGAGTL